MTRKLGDVVRRGIGLCRTEHMFFGSERLPIVQNMIMSKSEEDQQNSIDQLLPLQRDDFHGLFKAMDGLPVVIRLLDPPLHEFLPAYGELMRELADLHVKAALAENPEERHSLPKSSANPSLMSMAVTTPASDKIRPCATAGWGRRWHLRK